MEDLPSSLVSEPESPHGSEKKKKKKRKKRKKKKKGKKPQENGACDAPKKNSERATG
jgi:hypothetical protein